MPTETRQEPTMIHTTAATVVAGDTLNRVDPASPTSWCHDRAYDAKVLRVERETHGGTDYAVFHLEPKAPARSSLVRTPLTRGVFVTSADA